MTIVQESRAKAQRRKDRRARSKQHSTSSRSSFAPLRLCANLLLKLSHYFILLACAAGIVCGQQTSPAAPSPATAKPPSVQASPQPNQSPQSPPTSPPDSNVTPSSAPSNLPTTTQPAGQSAAGSLSLDEVLRLANAQVSGFQQAQLNERVAAEDVRQAQAAFLPKITTPLDYIYTSPAQGLPSGEPRGQSFIANNAISEYQALVSVTGDIDISGRLRATLARNRALLEAARAGTEVARSALRQATVEAYYGLALAAAQLRSAEQNLSAAQEFERITSLLLTGGEVAPVDLTRAQLQTVQRQGELEQARANESVAAD
ncbi:MAG: TolC family protein, partial [Acidobacteria bacterium]|nr:TolC family protein [Acidobacteriota bacterium]